ncbi:Amino acid/polyamine transporter I [Penicillium expansum]|nr:Amino acid/polyamine transporter I [Penicillium expansum]KGO63790.1 Amino acid/polyamine transporter I [Penicillium expansum]
MADEAAHQRRSSKTKYSEPRPPEDTLSIEEGKQTSANGVLEALGYEPELVRNRSTLQVTFMSFVLAAIPYGLATTFTYPLIGGGPVNIIWGWLAVSLITLFNLGSTLFLVACINVFESAPGVGIFQAETYQVFLIFIAVTVLANAISAFGNKWLPLLDTFAIFWTLAGLLAIVICVLAIAKGGRRDAKYVFTSFEPVSGWPAGWSFCVGLLQAAYSTSSTGMVICMCEEVQQPSTQVPKAMVGTVILNTLAGFLFLVPLVFVLPDTKALAALESGQPIPTIIQSAVGSPVGSFLLLLPLIVLSLFCVIGCTTAVSRSTWAFARDGGIPGSIWWKQVNKDGVPFNAMMLGMVVQILLGFIYFGSTTAFNAFTGVGVITLTVSYACPIAVSLAGGRKQIKNGQFDLGTLGLVCNIIALGWSILVIPLFCMPSSIPVAADTVNYAPVVFVAFILLASGWYWVWGYENGPKGIQAIGDKRGGRISTLKIQTTFMILFFRLGLRFVSSSQILPRLRDVHNVDKPSPMLFICLIFGGHIISFREMAALDVKERKIPESPLVSVEINTKFKWYQPSIFTRWLPSTNQTVILAFDLDPPIKDRFLIAAMKSDESWLNDPFWVYPCLVEQIALIQEPSVWGIRDHVRLMETDGKPEGRPQPNYRRLHDIARHAIHVNETLDVALQNLEHILVQHESYTNSNPDNASPASEDIRLRLRSWQSFIENLRSRSISNEKRLQNEIQLAFNTVAQHDASVTLEIGRATQLDSATMKTIAFVTLTFLPPTFICAIFSMSFFNFGGDNGWTMSSKFWIYWVFAIPTTAFTTLVWTYWPNIRRILFSKNE